MRCTQENVHQRGIFIATSSEIPISTNLSSYPQTQIVRAHGNAPAAALHINNDPLVIIPPLFVILSEAKGSIMADMKMDAPLSTVGRMAIRPLPSSISITS